MSAEILELGIIAGSEKKYTFVWSEKINDTVAITAIGLSAIDTDSQDSVNIFEDKGFQTYKNTVLIKNILAGKRYRLRLEATFGEEKLIEHVYINGLDA